MASASISTQGLLLPASAIEPVQRPRNFSIGSGLVHHLSRCLPAKLWLFSAIQRGHSFQRLDVKPRLLLQAAIDAPDRLGASQRRQMLRSKE